MRMALSPKGSEPVTDHNVEPKIFAQVEIEQAENKLMDFALIAIAILLVLILITYCICSNVNKKLKKESDKNSKRM